VPIQLPIGQAGDFEGMIDLVRMRALYYRNDLGTEIEDVEIPEALREVADAAAKN